MKERKFYVDPTQKSFPRYFGRKAGRATKISSNSICLFEYPSNQNPSKKLLALVLVYLPKSNWSISFVLLPQPFSCFVRYHPYSSFSYGFLWCHWIKMCCCWSCALYVFFVYLAHIMLLLLPCKSFEKLSILFYFLKNLWNLMKFVLFVGCCYWFLTLLW